ncbi:hypothetical protein [Thiorhodococcus fuscus]|uniref:DnaT DNA-binding domain-containing protein n=1 Tax=Thiorhodococcus fuscus TaxID=527200 RepID=A0ABW4YB97_9GAMM
MRDYGRIHTKFWEQPEISELSLEGRLLAVYLLTSQHSNMLGCYRLSTGYVMDDLRLPHDTAEAAFAELETMGFLHRCRATGWVLLPKYLKYNPVENPNQAKAALKLVDKVPSKAAFIPALQASIQRYGGKYVHTLLSSPLFAVAVVGQSGGADAACPGWDASLRSPAHSTASEMGASHHPAAGQGVGTVPEQAKIREGAHEGLDDGAGQGCSKGSANSSGKASGKGSVKGSSKGYPNQEQEQEQEQEQDTVPDSSELLERDGGMRAGSRGARLSIQELPPDWRAFATKTRPELDADFCWEKFRDYWVAVPGAKGRKIDWAATWRNFVRNEFSRGGSHGHAARQHHESATDRRSRINAELIAEGLRAAGSEMD